MNKIFNELQKFEQETDSMDEKDILKRIGELDKKYSTDLYYQQNINGFLSNIGTDKKSEIILKSVIKRLQSAIKELNSILRKAIEKKPSECPEYNIFIMYSKYHYDLANTISSKADVIYGINPKIEDLIEGNEYYEQRTIFNNINPEVEYLQLYLLAQTNTANLLEKFGRNYEAILAYDKAIAVENNFGMALGNKAIALIYYFQLSLQKNMALLNEAQTLLNHALQDEYLEEIGGTNVRTAFQEQIKLIDELYFKCDCESIKGIFPNTVDDYEKFVMSNNLYLNYDFGYYYNKSSITDNFCLTSTESIEEIETTHFDKNPHTSKRIYFCSQIFNQILEDFATARYNFYQSLKSDYNSVDIKTNYISTFDNTKHSIKYGNLKNIFASLTNILDKVAHVLLIYYKIEDYAPNDSKIYFKDLLNPSFKNKVIDFQNRHLLALCSLAKDFSDEKYPYYKYKKLRNRITHSFVNINIGSDHKQYNDGDFEIEESTLIENTGEMFTIVKAAILYLTLATHETSGELKDSYIHKEIIFEK